MDPRAPHPGVHLDHARTVTGALALHVEHPAAEPERLNRPHAQIDQPAHGLLLVVWREVQACFLEGGLGGGPVLGHAGEHALAVLQDQVDIELHAI